MTTTDWYIAKGRLQFARANGWRPAKSYFSVREFLTAEQRRSLGCRLDGYSDCPGLDHPELFRKDRRPVAIVGHNYGGLDGHDTREVVEIATRYGLGLHFAPAGAAASWYFPGSTTLVVLTRPEITTIVWPTADEMAAMIVDRDAYWARQRAREAELAARCQRLRA
jgi:hypothetical protein